MSLKIINQEYSIVSIGPDQLPEEMKGHTLVFYSRSRDAIVVNEDSPLFPLLGDFIEVYLSLSDQTRKEVMQFASDGGFPKDICKIERVLNQIIRIRRKLYRSRAVMKGGLTA